MYEETYLIGQQMNPLFQQNVIAAGTNRFM